MFFELGGSLINRPELEGSFYKTQSISIRCWYFVSSKVGEFYLFWFKFWILEIIFRLDNDYKVKIFSIKSSKSEVKTSSFEKYRLHRFSMLWALFKNWNSFPFYQNLLMILITNMYQYCFSISGRTSKSLAAWSPLHTFLVSYLIA